MPAAGPAGEGVIDISVRRVEQLFQSLDPSPFHERALDPDAADYILGWARDLPTGAALRLRVHLPPDEAVRAEVRAIAPALASHFGYLALAAARERRELLRLGWRYLAVGLILLAFCLFAAQLIRARYDSPFAQVLAEGLMILGWVANWKPLETFLYGLWPIGRRLRLLRRLAAAPVAIRA